MATTRPRLFDQLCVEVIPFHCHNLRRIDVYTICKEWGYSAHDCDFWAFRPASLGQVVLDVAPDSIDDFRAWYAERETETERNRAQWDAVQAQVDVAHRQYEACLEIGDINAAIFIAKAIRVELACYSHDHDRHYSVPDWAKPENQPAPVVYEESEFNRAKRLKGEDRRKKLASFDREAWLQSIGYMPATGDNVHHNLRYSIFPMRYRKGMFGIKTWGIDGFKSSACYEAERVASGNWVGREGCYAVNKAGVQKFLSAMAARDMQVAA